MAGWRETLKHAFAIPGERDFVVTAEEQQVAQQVVEIIRVRGLVVPALVFLESFRPLNSLGAQALHFLTPFVAALADATAYETFARLLDRPGAVEYLCRQLEAPSRPASAPDAPNLQS